MNSIRRLLLLFLAAGSFALATPRLAAVAPYFFIQLSDPQLGMFSKNHDFVQDAANFEFVVAAINRLHPAFVVITGDLVNRGGDAAQIAEFRRIVGQVDRSIPVHIAAGNHDLENVPTPATIEAYERIFGPDHYSFSHDGFVGIVLDSTLISAPNQATERFKEQESWLRAELQKARQQHPQHIVVFQHHPWFLKSADEADQYFNIPQVRRAPYLSLFRESGVRYLFSGHYHRNADARDGEMENITTGAVGMPLGGAQSGIRVAIVRDDRIESHFYALGEIPATIELAPAAAGKPKATAN